MNRTPPAKAATKPANIEKETTEEPTPVESDISEEEGTRVYTSAGAEGGDESTDKRKRPLKGTPERKAKRQRDAISRSPKVGIPVERRGTLDTMDLCEIYNQASAMKKEIMSIKRMMDSSRNIRSDITAETATLIIAAEKLTDLVDEAQCRVEYVQEKRDCCTQTEVRKESHLVCRVGDVLSRGEGYAPLEDILGESWPEKCYKNVKRISVEDKAPPGCDTLVVLPEGGGSPEGTRKWRSLFPDWGELVESLIPNNDIEFLRMSTETTSRDGTKKVRVQNIYAGICKGCFGEKVEWEELYSLARGMKVLAIEHGVRELLVSLAKGMNTEWAVKIFQYVFNSTDIILYMSGQQNNKEAVRKNKEEEVLIVKATDGRNYSQIVRGLASKIDIGKVGAQVRSVRQTQSGDLLLRVGGGRGVANALREEISGKDINTQVTIRENRAVIFVTDIVAGFEREEVRSVLAAEMGEPGINVASLRPTRDGNLVATVEVTPQTAKTWISRGRVKIGWVSCRVRGKPDIKRCFRCLEFGHTRTECKGQDRSKVCIRCGLAEGHRASQCKGEVFCGRCKVGGHRQDSRACPYFKELLETLRRRKTTVRDPTT